MGFTAVNQAKKSDALAMAQSSESVSATHKVAPLSSTSSLTAASASQSFSFSGKMDYDDSENIMKMSSGSVHHTADSNNTGETPFIMVNNTDQTTNQPAPAPANPHFINPFIYPQNRSRANPPLDLNTVIRRGEFVYEQSQYDDHKRRVFDLQDAPTYRPTMAEFQDPMAYVQSISKEVSNFGMAKIIPPKQWSIPFCLDTEMLWFKTRRQNLSLRNVGQKAANDFVESLYYFHRLGRNNQSKLPSIDKRPLDLFHLHQCVHLRGGFEEVCKRKLWAQIGRELGYSGKIMTSLSTSLKSAYQKLLYPYDLYLSKEGAGDLVDGIHIPAFSSPSYKAGSPAENDKHSLKRTFSETQDQSNGTHDRTRLVKLPNGIEATLQADGFCSESEKAKNVTPHVTTSRTAIRRIKSFTGIPSIPEDPTIPPFDNWHEGLPVISDDDQSFDFKAAPSYNLRQFQQKATMFKMNYFSALIKQSGLPVISQYAVEKEYWRLLNDASENVEVEYALDMHSSVLGTAFSKPETNLHDPSILDPWNINALPFNHLSLFRFVSSDVPYLAEPWLNISMMFSTKNWHFEDFFSYQMHYHHLGDTKTWYSIPAGDFEKFQSLLESIIGQEEIEKNPSLLLEPEYMISPNILKENGINCFAVNQNPGEFIVTFPKSHHAEMNHGFNYSEHVNFLAADDWIDYGYECLDMYNKYKVEPPFSIPHMLFNLGDSNSAISTTTGYSTAMNKMMNDELELRQKIRSKYPKIKEMVLKNDKERKCVKTNDICYLSAVTRISDNTKVFSVKYLLNGDLEDGDGDDYQLELLHDDEEFKRQCISNIHAGSQPTQWYKKLSDFLRSSPRPALDKLSDLVKEGEAVQHPVYALYPLKRFVESASAWISRVDQFLRPPANGSPISDISSQDFQQLLDESGAVMFSCPEVELLRERAQELQEYRKHVLQLLMGQPHHTQTLGTYMEVLNRGKSFHVDLKETRELENIISKIKWGNDAAEMTKRVLNLDEIKELVRQGESLGITPENDGLMAQLSYNLAAGITLERKAQVLLDSHTIHMDQLLSILAESDRCRLSSETLKKLQEVRHRFSIVFDSAQKLNARTQEPIIENRPLYLEAKTLIEEARWLNDKPSAQLIEKNLRLVEEWMRKGKRLFGKGNAPLYILGSHLAYVFERDLLCYTMEYRFENDPQQVPSTKHSKDGEEIKKEDDSTEPEGEDAEMTEIDGKKIDQNYSESKEPSATAEAEPLDKTKKVNSKHFCICRLADSGVMFECNICDEWYHAKCMKIGRGKFRSTDPHICPICNWKTVIPRDAIRARLADFKAWAESADNLPYQPDELKVVKHIVVMTETYRDFINQKVVPEDRKFTTEDMAEVKYYVRRLEGAETVLVDELHKLYKILQELDPHRYGGYELPVVDTQQAQAGTSAVSNGGSRNEAPNE